MFNSQNSSLKPVIFKDSVKQIHKTHLMVIYMTKWKILNGDKI